MSTGGTSTTALQQGTAARPAPKPALHDVDWHAAVDQVVWVLPEHRQATVPSATAQRALRCTDASFAQLLDLGLPTEEGPDGPVHDPWDLKNVGLYSGSGTTDVEVAMRMILGFMRSSVAELTGPKPWTYRVALGPGPGDGAARQVHRPTPEVFGGQLHRWETPAGPAPDLHPDLLPLRRGEAATGAVTTAGGADLVRSPEVRQMMAELLASGVRWQYLADQAELDPEGAIARGAANCTVLCKVLEHRLTAAGFEARSHRGWMLGMAQSDHGWVEVTDEDGSLKVLDPSFGLLAGPNGFGGEAFHPLVYGARLNRVMPTRCLLNHPLVADADGQDDDLTFTCQASKQPAVAPAGTS